MPNNLIELSQTIQKLNKEKKFNESLLYFKEKKLRFSTEEIGKNSFLVSAMINALRHTNYIDKAFKFLEIHGVVINENTQEIILSSYGWLLYDKYKLENHVTPNHDLENECQDENDFYDLNSVIHLDKSATIKLIEDFIPLILKFESIYSYNVISKLFNLVLKVEKKKANANWKLISEFCSLISPSYLKTDCESKEIERKGKMVSVEFSSDREKWYANKSKALLKLGKFQECCEISNEALESFSKFHYSNDIWFARKIALSKKQLGNSQDAISELLKILKRKKEWFIEKELAELYMEAGNIQSALNFAMQAVNNFGDLEYKIELLFLIGELLKAKGENDLAFKHFSLSRLIRLSEEWNIPLKLSSAIESFKRDDIPIEKLQILKSELKRYWNTFNQKEQKVSPITEKHSNSIKPILTGKIDKILHCDNKGIDGFIKYNDNKSVYFRIYADDPIKPNLKVGSNIQFKIIQERDGMKEKAIRLRILNNESNESLP